MSVRRALRWLIVIVALEAAAALAGCASGHQAAPPVGTPRICARMNMARQMTVTQGDWARAFPMLDELHRERPEDAEVLTLRGIVYRERGLFHDAEEDLKAALKAAPDDRPRRTRRWGSCTTCRCAPRRRPSTRRPSSSPRRTRRT